MEDPKVGRSKKKHKALKTVQRNGRYNQRWVRAQENRDPRPVKPPPEKKGE
jgi:hypothetical protein